MNKQCRHSQQRKSAAIKVEAFVNDYIFYNIFFAVEKLRACAGVRLDCDVQKGKGVTASSESEALQQGRREIGCGEV